MAKLAWVLVTLLAIALAVVTTLYVTERSESDTPSLVVKRSYLCSHSDAVCERDVRRLIKEACVPTDVAAVEVLLSRTFDKNAGVTTFPCSTVRASS